MVRRGDIPVRRAASCWRVLVRKGAGATWPYKQDPHDSNIRIAPTLPPLDELDAAMDVFVCCAKLAYTEKLLQG